MFGVFRRDELRFFDVDHTAVPGRRRRRRVHKIGLTRQERRDLHDVAHGGSIQGEIDALNNIIDIAVPKHEEEGGTYIIPGHGRICDEFDVVEYRDMVTLIRDRVQNAIKKGMTLEQIKSAGLTKDYDARWSAKEGPGRADNFVTSVYKSLMASASK